MKTVSTAIPNVREVFALGVRSGFGRSGAVDGTFYAAVRVLAARQYWRIKNKGRANSPRIGGYGPGKSIEHPYTVDDMVQAILYHQLRNPDAPLVSGRVWVRKGEPHPITRKPVKRSRLYPVAYDSVRWAAGTGDVDYRLTIGPDQNPNDYPVLGYEGYHHRSVSMLERKATRVWMPNATQPDRIAPHNGDNSPNPVDRFDIPIYDENPETGHKRLVKWLGSVRVAESHRGAELNPLRAAIVREEYGLAREHPDVLQLFARSLSDRSIMRRRSRMVRKIREAFGTCRGNAESLRRSAIADRVRILDGEPVSREPFTIGYRSASGRGRATLIGGGGSKGFTPRIRAWSPPIQRVRPDVLPATEPNPNTPVGHRNWWYSVEDIRFENDHNTRLWGMTPKQRANIERNLRARIRDINNRNLAESTRIGYLRPLVRELNGYIRVWRRDPNNPPKKGCPGVAHLTETYRRLKAEAA